MFLRFKVLTKKILLFSFVLCVGVFYLNAQCNYEQLYWAISLDDICLLERLFSEGIHPDRVVYCQRRPLTYSVLCGSVKAVEFFLSKKANPDLFDLNGDTPLSIAAHYGKSEIARLLLANNADINKPNILGITPLYSAVLKKHYDIVEMLLQNHVNVNYYYDIFPKTPLCAAVGNADIFMVWVLLSYGAYPDFMILPEGKPLHEVAAERGHQDIATLLLESKVYFNFVDKADRLPQPIAWKKRCLEASTPMLSQDCEQKRQKVE